MRLSLTTNETSFCSLIKFLNDQPRSVNTFNVCLCHCESKPKHVVISNGTNTYPVKSTIAAVYVKKYIQEITANDDKRTVNGRQFYPPDTKS